MESNEQTELTSEIKTDSDREQSGSSGGSVVRAWIELKRKRTHGHGQQCGDGRWGGVVQVAEGIRGDKW